MPYDNDFEQEDELTLLDVFNILWSRKLMIIGTTFVFAVVSTIYAFTLPFIYRAECRILPPQRSNTIGGLAAQLGGLADFVGLPSATTSGRLMLGILQGDSVVDAIIDRFNLMEEMSQDIRLRARASVLGKLDAEEDARSGIVTIACTDKDPQRAADLANAFVDELQKKMREIALNETLEKKAFFDTQFKQAQQELQEAEEAMINYQQSSGLIALEAQTQSLIASISSLRNQIAAKNVEISTLSSYTRKDNPRLRVAQTQLDAMNKELRRLEEEQRRSDSRRSVLSGDVFASLGQLPEMGLEYQRKVRNLRFATAKYELMFKQLENTKLSEEGGFSSLSIVDIATPPDWKYRPRRALIMIIGTAAGGFLSVFLAFLMAHINAVKEARGEY